MKPRLFYLALCLLVFSRASVAQIVFEDTHIDFEADGTFEANYRGGIAQHPSGDGSDTSVWFNYDGSHLTAVAWNLDEESDWYVVNPGDVFGFSTIESGQFTPIFTTDNSRGPVLIGTGEIYLGVATDANSCFDPGCPPRDMFGWVRLEGTGLPPSLGGGGSLEMLGNAVAYGSPGVIVGTTNIIPEPSTVALAWLAIATLHSRHRR